MSRNNTMIFENMRPPVAAERGRSPLRGKNVKKVFGLANDKFESKSGMKISKELVV